MILQQKVNEILVEGEDLGSHRMHISKEAENHLIRMATEWSYKSPLESGIRECVSNALDSHLEAGNTDPVIVTLRKNELNNWELEIKDEGLGLDDISFKRYIMGIGESTKRDNPNVLGGYGCGSKAFCSYTNSYQYLCRKDGIERKYLIVKGEEVPEDMLLYENETTEKDGVIVTIPLNTGYREFDSCIAAIKQQLSYLDNIWYNIPNFDNDFQIFKHELFEWNSLNKISELHISLKGIYYPINWDKLNIPRINIPLALKFDDYEFLQPVFNREELIWNTISKQAILNRIEKVGDYLVEKYNEEIKEPSTLFHAYSDINPHDLHINLVDLRINIRPIVQYSSVQVKEIQLKSVSLRKPEYYKTNLYTLLESFIIKGEYFYGRFKAKSYTGLDYQFRQKKKVNLVSSLVGNYKEYLKESYEGYFVNHMTRSLNWYRSNVLGTVHKRDWRKYIQEWQAVEQSIIEDFCIDLRGKEDSPEFEKWIEERKEARKKDRIANPSKYNCLNKQDGDVTIAFARPSNKTGGMVFEKAVYPIKDLYKEKQIIVCTDAEKGVGENLACTIKQKVCIIGVREFSKIKHINQFKLYKDFMEDHKPFRRIATAIYAEKMLQTYNKIASNRSEVIENCLKPVHDTILKIQDYIRENISSSDTEIANAILEVAKAKNLWDEEIMWEIKKVEKTLGTFDFMEYLVVPRYWDNETIKKLNKFIYQNLLFKFYFCFGEWNKFYTISISIFIHFLLNIFLNP